MSEARRSPDRSEMSRSYGGQNRGSENASVCVSRRTDGELKSATEIIADAREKIQQLQLKDANYRSQETKLLRENEFLKKQVAKLEMDIEKKEEHREQDAEALLEQEEKLSRLKGRYRVSENPNEVVKLKKNIQKLNKEENEVLKDVAQGLTEISQVYGELAQIVPVFYEELRKLKFYGDKQMNEILLRQINIYVEHIQEKAKEFEKQKLAKFEENKELRAKLKSKYTEHDELKRDTIEDYKQLYKLQRQLNFYETDFIIEREEKEKLK